MPFQSATSMHILYPFIVISLDLFVLCRTNVHVCSLGVKASCSRHQHFTPLFTGAEILHKSATESKTEAVTGYRLSRIQIVLVCHNGQSKDLMLCKYCPNSSIRVISRLQLCVGSADSNQTAGLGYLQRWPLPTALQTVPSSSQARPGQADSKPLGCRNPRPYCSVAGFWTPTGPRAAVSPRQALHSVG